MDGNMEVKTKLKKGKVELLVMKSDFKKFIEKNSIEETER